MKFLIVVTNTNLGGVTISAVNLANELVCRNHNVTLLDMQGDFLCREKIDKGVNLQCLIGRSRLWNLGEKDLKKARGLKKSALAFLGLFKKLTIKSGLWFRLIFKKQKHLGEFDVAIAFRQCAPCYSFVLNKVKAKKKIGYVHGDLTYMGDISAWKKYMPKFDKIAYVSDAVKQGFVEKIPKLSINAHTIYNMLDISTIKKFALENCEEFFDDKIKITTIARIENNQKRIDRIIDVCKKLKEDGITNFVWYIVGTGPDYESCLRQAKELNLMDVLYFCGRKENPYPYVTLADFFVLPSLWESFGLVVVESLILHKPVVACEYPALKEILEKDVTGLYAEQNVESLYCEVKRLITDNALREQLTQNCLKYEYSNDKAYQQLMEAIS